MIEHLVGFTNELARVVSREKVILEISKTGRQTLEESVEREERGLSRVLDRKVEQVIEEGYFGVKTYGSIEL